MIQIYDYRVLYLPSVLTPKVHVLTGVEMIKTKKERQTDVVIVYVCVCVCLCVYTCLYSKIPFEFSTFIIAILQKRKLKSREVI